MIHFLRAQWTAHPWLTGLEVAASAATAVEIVMLAHVLLGWGWGVLSRNPDAIVYTRFVFLTGEDAKFGAGLVALFSLVPLGAVLLLTGGIGAGWGALFGTPVRPFFQALAGGVGLLGFSAGLFFWSRALGGGIIPH